MLFHSIGFLLLFLPLFLLTMKLASAGTIRALVLLFFSYLFYSGAEPSFVLILLLSSTVDYIAALRLYATLKIQIKKIYLLVSIG